MCVCCIASVEFNSLRPHGLQPARLLCSWGSPARILGSILPSSGESSRPRDQTYVSYVSCIGRWVVYHWHHRGSPKHSVYDPKVFTLNLPHEKNIVFNTIHWFYHSPIYWLPTARLPFLRDFLQSVMAQMVENLLVMLETWAGSLGQEDPVKEEMANSSILAWRIPWTEEPGWLQSIGLERVGNKWVTFTFHFPSLY